MADDLTPPTADPTSAAPAPTDPSQTSAPVDPAPAPAPADPTQSPPPANPTQDAAVSQALLGQDTSLVNPSFARRRKESAPASAPDTATETATPQNAESEPPRELEPEIEKVTERVEENRATPPTETAVSAKTMPAAPPPTVAQPVIVLPLTEEKMQAGAHKNTTNSVRWLYEWCVRQIQKFKTMVVVYRK